MQDTLPFLSRRKFPNTSRWTFIRLKPPPLWRSGAIFGTGSIHRLETTWQWSFMSHDIPTFVIAFVSAYQLSKVSIAELAKNGLAVKGLIPSSMQSSNCVWPHISRSVATIRTLWQKLFLMKSKSEVMTMVNDLNSVKWDKVKMISTTTRIWTY